MPLDRAGADEELGTDLRVRAAGDREARNVLLVRREVVAGVVATLADRRAGREQLVARAFGETMRADRAEHLMRDPQLLARVRSAAFAAQPLAVEQMAAGELHAYA